MNIPLRNSRSAPPGDRGGERSEGRDGDERGGGGHRAEHHHRARAVREDQAQRAGPVERVAKCCSVEETGDDALNTGIAGLQWLAPESGNGNIRQYISETTSLQWSVVLSSTRAHPTKRSSAPSKPSAHRAGHPFASAASTEAAAAAKGSPSAAASSPSVQVPACSACDRSAPGPGSGGACDTQAAWGEARNIYTL